MEKLIVSLERDGSLQPVGSIRGESPLDACFALHADTDQELL